MQKLSLHVLAQKFYTLFSFSLVTFTFFAVTLYAPLLHANINTIKGTYDILKPEYKHFSVIHGAVAWETGAIRRMYDLGALGYHGDKIKSKTIALIHQIFYRRANTSGAAEFVLTKKFRDQSLSDAQIACFTADALMYLDALAKKPSFTKYQNIFSDLQSADKKNKQKISQLLTEQKKIIIHELEAETLFDTYEDGLKALLPLIVGAYLECAAEGYLPAYTPSFILCSFFYKKTNGNRNALETYYKQLEKSVTCLNTPENWESWKNDLFNKNDLTVLQDELIHTPPTNETIQALYEKIAYVALSPKKYPPVISYSTATIKNGSQSEQFPDCMENTLRNILNFFCYKQFYGFDIALLEQRLDTEVLPSLKIFFTKNSDSLSAGEQQIHSNWAQTVISDIPFVSYNNALPSRQRASNKGFIKIDTPLTPALEKYLKEKKYTLLSRHYVAYELNPSLKNTIIVLNHLLGLKLFDHNLAEEFIKEDFVQTYLPKFLEKIHTSIPKSFVLEDIDTIDYTNKVIILPLQFSFTKPDNYTADLSIKISSGHGEFFFGEENEKLQDVFSKITSFENCPLSSILLTHRSAHCIDMFDPTTYFLWLFSEPIDSLSWLLSLKDKKIPTQQNPLNQLLFVAQNNKTEAQRTKATFIIYKAALKNSFIDEDFILEVINSAKDFIESEVLYASKDLTTEYLLLGILTDMIQRNLGTQKILHLAQTFSASENSDAQQFSIDIFIRLIGEKKGIKEAIKAAKACIVSEDTEVQEVAFNLFTALVKKGYALPEATEAAEKNITSDDEVIQDAAQELLEIIKEQKASTSTEAQTATRS